ncbi:MAG: twin transmembrane helix small protein [Alphaproteobacteria bacterium]
MSLALIPIILVLLAVLGVLAAGIVGMVRSGGADPKRSNKLMQWRVILQFAAVLLMFIFLAMQA